MKKLFIPTLCLLLLCCLSLVGCGDNLGGKKVSEKYAANYVLLEDAGY